MAHTHQIDWNNTSKVIDWVSKNTSPALMRKIRTKFTQLINGWTLHTHARIKCAWDLLVRSVFLPLGIAFRVNFIQNFPSLCSNTWNILLRKKSGSLHWINKCSLQHTQKKTLISNYLSNQMLYWCLRKLLSSTKQETHRTTNSWSHFDARNWENAFMSIDPWNECVAGSRSLSTFYVSIAIFK